MVKGPQKGFTVVWYDTRGKSRRETDRIWTVYNQRNNIFVFINSIHYLEILRSSPVFSSPNPDVLERKNLRGKGVSRELPQLDGQIRETGKCKEVFLYEESPSLSLKKVTTSRSFLLRKNTYIYLPTITTLC